MFSYDVDEKCHITVENQPLRFQLFIIKLEYLALALELSIIKDKGNI